MAGIDRSLSASNNETPVQILPTPLLKWSGLVVQAFSRSVLRGWSTGQTGRLGTRALSRCIALGQLAVLSASRAHYQLDSDSSGVDTDSDSF
jgi:hypothetical protein